MKNRFLIILFFTFCLRSVAQPQGINYQGVARDSIGHPVINQNISLRLSILDSTASGSAVYVETQNAITSGSGLFNVSIGMGSVVSGVFTDVPWGAGDKWLKVEMDLGGGSNYVLIGTTQFMSVPYALFAGISGATISSGTSQSILYLYGGGAPASCPAGWQDNGFGSFNSTYNGNSGGVNYTYCRTCSSNIPFSVMYLFSAGVPASCPSGWIDAGYGGYSLIWNGVSGGINYTFCRSCYKAGN